MTRLNLQQFASGDYWRKREERNLKSNLKQEAEYDKEIERIYKDMLDVAQKEIDAFFGKYADAEGITLAEAKKRVSQLEIEAYERKAKKYVEAASQDRANTGKTNKRAFYFSKRANEEMRLYNLTMKVNRLEMLKANIGLELIKGHAELETFMSEILQGRTQEELERQAGILGKSIKNNAKLADTIVNASFKNATFSDRIWMYHDQMKADLSKLLQSGMIQGKNSRQLAKDLRKYYYGPEYLKNGKKGAVYNTERLMRTELARVQTEAQKQAYIKEGTEEYKFMALGDACDICMAINGKSFKVKDMMPGENAPPLHPHCRCTTVSDDSKGREELDALLDFVSKGGTEADWNKFGKAAWQDSITAKPLANSGGSSRIKSIDIDDFEVVTYGKNIDEDVKRTIFTIFKQAEKNGELFISEVVVKDIPSGESGTPVLQIEPTAFGTAVLNINASAIAGKTIQEVNKKFEKSRLSIVNTLEEAVKHECGHAKLIKGMSIESIDEFYRELEKVHIDGISSIAYKDGAECIAEVEVLLFRGDEVPEEAMKLYKKYIKE